MRKFATMLLSFFVAGVLFGAAPVGAEPSDACGDAPAAAGESSVTVCVAGVGSLTAAQEGSGGYVVADGDSANSAINPCLDGFAGVQVDDAGNPGYAAESDGDYSYPHSSSGDPDPTECAPA
jgi:hypothetical protein